ncbi:Non-specific serine/threonine protein kinase [Handroanthus impetiginosus]|uniref:Non-specific serine/threonine protein kinase n=1 Tax=Handroanthus impetiginosus TaxID=429701 RepID=A0A2G9H9X2_9LAMI|nr:Non-specific serine/threonine protein kinase [Handroanthus impetiginosus]
MKFPASNLFRCFHPSKSTVAVKDEEDVPALPNPNFRVFSYDELKAATQGFKNKIGEGAFGCVYKGRLTGDNNFIAVKVLSIEVESMRGEREFISELAALSDIKHEK